MNLITKEELIQINGGGISRSFFIGLLAAGAFIIGFLDGFHRPLACR